MNIGEASAASGVSPKMIRYYESIGLLPTVARTPNSYRVYTPEAVHTLGFIRRARTLGFSIADIEKLLALWRDHTRASGEVKAIARSHVADLQARIDELAAMRQTLEHLIDHCHGDHRPDCPILEDLARPPAARTG